MKKNSKSSSRLSALSKPSSRSAKLSSCNVTNGIHNGIVITDEYAGEIICNSCGVVLEEETLSYKPEMSGSKDNNGSSSGNALTASSHMMTSGSKYIPTSTSIGTNTKSFGTKDHNGKAIPSVTKHSLTRLYNSGNIQRTKSDSGKRGLVSGLARLNTLVKKMNLPDSTHQDAALLYTRTHAVRLSKGRTIMGMVAACLYHACKKSRNPRDMAEICGHSNMEKKHLFRIYRKIVDTLELYDKNDDENENDGKYGHTARNDSDKDGVIITATLAQQRHIKNIPKMASKLNLPQRICKKAADIILAQDDHTLSGKNPNVTASSAIYIACNNSEKYSRVTQREISNAAGITEVLIRNVSKLMRKR